MRRRLTDFARWCVEPCPWEVGVGIFLAMVTGAVAGLAAGVAIVAGR